MNIELYGFGAMALIIVGLYFWQRVTARQLKTAEAALAGAEAVGKQQEVATVEADKKSERIKDNIDEKLKNTLHDIDAAYVGLRDGSSGDMSRPDEIRTRGIKESDILRHPLYINLAQHPATLETGGDFASKFFPPMYAKASTLEIALAVGGTILGVISWFTSGDIEAVRGVGPSTPATKRGFSGCRAVAVSAASRATCAAARFNSVTMAPS